MAKFVLISDVHIADRPPSSCTDTYSTDILDLLYQVMDLAVRIRARAVIIAGDLFHHKAPSRTSHRLVMQLIGAFSSGIPVHVVPGNHDMQNDRLDSLDNTQPLGVLFEAGIVEILDGWARSLPLFGVPWLQGYGNYADTGEAVDHEVGAAFARWRERAEPTRSLVVAHAPLYPPGQELPYEYFPAERWAEALGGQGSVFYGHVHEPHGVYEVGGVTFCNNGALSRGSIHEYNLARQVGATVWDDETLHFEFVPLKARPASEVFRLQEKQEATDIQGRLDEFLSADSSTSLGVVSTESVLEHFRSLDGIGPEELGLIEELLQGA